MLVDGAAEVKLVIRSEHSHGTGSARHGGVDSRLGGTGADPNHLASGVLVSTVPMGGLWIAPQCVPWPHDGGGKRGTWCRYVVPAGVLQVMPALDRRIRNTRRGPVAARFVWMSISVGIQAHLRGGVRGVFGRQARHWSCFSGGRGDWHLHPRPLACPTTYLYLAVC